MFALRHGWTCDLLETRRDLVLPPDEARLAAVEADARQASRDYELVTWRDHVPEQLVDDRAVLEERMSTDAPHGEMPVEAERWDAQRIREIEELNVARGRTVLSAGAVRDGRLVAFTDLHVPLASSEHARQGATLVLREHRGHRLGALVKAAVLRDLATTFPQTRLITTYNLEGNAPMVAVNAALGFQPAGQTSMWSLRPGTGSRAG
jgi:RimJ/RimL family protein N-acetyltransferase